MIFCLFTDFIYKQDKYTMEPGRQIYLSNIKKKFGQKWFLNNKSKDFSANIKVKTKFGEKNFRKKKYIFLKIFGIFFFNFK